MIQNLLFNSFLIFFSIFFLLFLFLMFSFFNSSLVIEWFFLNSSDIMVSFPLVIDITSMTFLMSVLMISFSVMIFSSSYMKMEKFFIRFHLIVMSFVGSMMILILSPNLVSVLLGWDGLGVTSFLLVIYFGSSKSLNAGMLTALTNRVGDCLILISISIFFFNTSKNLFLINSESVSSYLVLLVLIAAFTKSAQIPFSAWLPAAMAAPTPVSSLVHSSTLVTAGVYLLIRFESCFSSWSYMFICWFGMLTMLMASFSALQQVDMKKIVALSTLSQLGLMMTSMGAMNMKLAFFHLLTHAYFKAMLFMSTGNLIHLSQGFQDMRSSFSGMKLNSTSSISMIALWSLSGIPFMSGFYSKDLIIEMFYFSFSFSVFAGLMLLFSVSLTSMYSMRFLVLMIFSSTAKQVLLNQEDNDKLMWVSMSSLLPAAVMGGSVLSWILFPIPLFMMVPVEMKFVVIFLIVIGAMFMFYTVFKNQILNKLESSIYLMWSLPLYSGNLNFLGFKLGEIVYSKADSKWTASLSAHLKFSEKNFWIPKLVSLSFFKMVFVLLILGISFMIY